MGLDTKSKLYTNTLFKLLVSTLVYRKSHFKTDMKTALKPAALMFVRVYEEVENKSMSRFM